jgi:hypothetical protein
LYVLEYVERGIASHGFQKRGHDEPRLPRVRLGGNVTMEITDEMIAMAARQGSEEFRYW